MRVLRDLVIVRKEKAPERIGLIYVPESSDGEMAPPYTGEVVSVGPMVQDPDIAEGARVAFNDLAGQLFEYEGEPLVLLAEKNIAAVLKKDAETD